MKSIFKSAILLAAVTAAVSSCGITTPSLTRGMQYTKMYDEKPLTLLIMPPINNTSNIEAKDYLYTSISRPLAEAGYYIVSPVMAMDILKAESAYDAENFVNAPLDQFRDFFGVDAIIFSEINAWTKVVTGIKTDIRYFIKSAKTGEILFDKRCELYLDFNKKQSDSNDWISALVNLTTAVINTATTEHITVARKANYFIFDDIPYGKYHPQYGLDKDYTADPSFIKETVK